MLHLTSLKVKMYLIQNLDVRFLNLDLIIGGYKKISATNFTAKTQRHCQTAY